MEQLLIEKGYFPKELPPVFTARPLASAFPRISLKSSNRTSKPISFSIPRMKGSRRVLKIPHPLFQILLVREISAYWDEIASRFVSPISLSTPTQNGKIWGRALEPKCSFQEVSEQKIVASTGAKVVLFTDISGFYSTIYTHSIPWALHGKPLAKKRRRDRKLLGNRLDQIVRNSQEGQTRGIPIGPDTSLVIAELIASKADQLLLEEMGKLKGFRFIDDYVLFFDSLSEAEKALSCLRKALAEFELFLNAYKTRISYLPILETQRWKWELNLTPICSELPARQRQELLHFFHHVLELSDRFPHDPVIKYAVGKTAEAEIHPENWDLYEAMLLRFLMEEPGCLPSVAELFQYYRWQKQYSPDLDLLKETIGKMLSAALEMRHDFEIVWLLWFCKTMRISLPESTGKMFSGYLHSLVGLLAFDLLMDGLLSGFDLHRWRNSFTYGDLYGEHWLFLYEATQKGWINEFDSWIAQDPFFHSLKINQVQFYDVGAHRAVGTKTNLRPRLDYGLPGG